MFGSKSRGPKNPYPARKNHPDKMFRSGFVTPGLQQPVSKIMRINHAHCTFFAFEKKETIILRGIPHIHILIRQRQGHNHGVLNVTKTFKYTGFFNMIRYTYSPKKKYISTKN
jgi:hypothetical protein